MPHLLIFGLGYSATHLATRLRAQGWQVSATRRAATADAHAVADEAALLPLIASATHILSSVPPEGEVDPILTRYGAAIAAAPARWIGYISSSGVYGDTGGAWVDESAPIGAGRRSARALADLAWGALRPDVHRFRLPGIYGPGRSPLDRVRDGSARRVDAPGQVFSRIHVDDLAAGIVASFDGPPGAYNLADDLPAAQSEVIAQACRLLGHAPPPLVPIDAPELSAAARAFYSENRRVANGKAKRLLGWRPAYPDYVAGLRALSAITSPASVSTAPATASGDQR